MPNVIQYIIKKGIWNEYVSILKFSSFDSYENLFHRNYYGSYVNKNKLLYIFGLVW